MEELSVCHEKETGEQDAPGFEVAICHFLKARSLSLDLVKISNEERWILC